MALTQIKGEGLVSTYAIGSEGGAVTTSIQQGVAKAWVQYNQTTPVVNDSVNISSVTDDSTGQFTHNFTNNMNNDDCAISSTPTGNARMNTTYASITTGSFQIRSYQIYSTDNYVDTTSGSSVHGDLA